MFVLFTWALLAQSEECPSLLQKAEQAFQARQFELAAAEFQRALPACPQKLPILVSLGQIQYLIGKETDAEETLKSAIAIDAKHTPAIYALGRVYYQQKRYLEAVEKYKQVVALEPKHHRAWDNLGLCYDALQMDSDALRSFFTALDIVMKSLPDYDWAHANLADFFLRRNQYEKAFQLAAEAARRNPQSARNAFLTAKALVNLEKVDVSTRWLEQAVKLDPTYPEPRYLLSQVYRKLGRKEDADRELVVFRELARKPRPR